MDENTFKNMLPKAEGIAADGFTRDYQIVKPIYDVANNKVHFQTEPFINENGEVVVKRLYSLDVVVQKVFQTVQEYTVTTKY